MSRVQRIRRAHKSAQPSGTTALLLGTAILLVPIVVPVTVKAIQDHTLLNLVRLLERLL